MGWFTEWLFEPATDLHEDVVEVVRKDVYERLNSDVEEEVQAALREGLRTGEFVYMKPEDIITGPYIEEKVEAVVQDNTPPNIFRPMGFNEYIGQESAKKILSKFISGTRKREVIFPHTLVHGSAGCGKTTLVKIIAHELKVNCIETITSDITDFDSLKDKIFEAQNGILFLDEIHGLDRNNAEKLYTIMEDFTYNGQTVPRFTLVGATTELGEIIQTRRPFYDRFKIIIALEDYTSVELAKIISQYQRKLFPKDIFDEKIYHLIAQNSRATPRTAIRLLEATIYFDGKINEVLESFQILKDGYTSTDLTLLKYMKSSNGAVGMQSIASYLGTSVANYNFSIEPYLLSTGMIVRTPRGRKLTDKANELIKELEK